MRDSVVDKDKGIMMIRWFDHGSMSSTSNYVGIVPKDSVSRYYPEAKKKIYVN